MKARDLEGRAETIEVSTPDALGSTSQENQHKCATAENVAITLRNAQESPLLILPAEIRNQIYAYVLGGKSLNFSVIKLRSRFKNRTDVKKWFEEEHDLALLETCRQTYEESCTLPFSLNPLLPCLRIGEEHFRNVTDTQRAAIRTLHVIVNWLCDRLIHDGISCHEDHFLVADSLPALEHIVVTVTEFMSPERRQRFEADGASDVRVMKRRSLRSQGAVREWLGEALKTKERHGVVTTITFKVWPNYR